jgi:bifunctional UDP-N-acetylglucosamine pyrophosphorylase / glucosamine-1-phosphate N-acetyltransferase
MPNDMGTNSYDETGNRKRVAQLQARGVDVWGAERVYVGAEVPLENISAGVILMNAMLTGEHTAIGRYSRIGSSGIATIHNTQIGEHVELGAGSYSYATMLDQVKVRGFAEIRQGTILEEQAEVGHNVGLKHTVFTAAVVAGSSINFCDAFVSGGKSRDDHSEIGSGCVNLNFDPHGDKFGSLIGDVTGVLLRSPRIFIGGNSGVVAPIHVDFGAVVRAGSIVRRDIGANLLYRGIEVPTHSDSYDPERYYDLRRKFMTTAKLVGNLHAFAQWYREIRLPYARGAEVFLYKSAIENILIQVQHRAGEIAKTIAKLEQSLFRPRISGSAAELFSKQHERIVEAREWIVGMLAGNEDLRKVGPPKGFIEEYQRLRVDRSHLNAVRSLSEPSIASAATWLQCTASLLSSQMQKVFV